MPRQRLSDRPVVTRLTTDDTRRLRELAQREERMVSEQARYLLSRALRAECGDAPATTPKAPASPGVAPR